MSALPPGQFRSVQAVTRDESCKRILAERWQELHVQAEELARMAGLSLKPSERDRANFSDWADRASEWQCELAWQGIDDIDAIMQPGLTALRTISMRGQDATAPALALWREFYASRNAVLELVMRPAKTEAAHAA